MNVELSRKVGRIMSTDKILSLTLPERKSFAKRVDKVKSFAELKEEDQELIMQAEEEWERRKVK